jgi:hypothetical protein
MTRHACCVCCEGTPDQPCNDVHANGPHVEPCPNGCNEHDEEGAP